MPRVRAHAHTHAQEEGHAALASAPEKGPACRTGLGRRGGPWQARRRGIGRLFFSLSVLLAPSCASASLTE